MEQWLLDGRDIIARRGKSMLDPKAAAANGFVEDISHGLVGMLKRPRSHGSGPQPSNAAPGQPMSYADCRVRYFIYYEGRLVDDHCSVFQTTGSTGGVDGKLDMAVYSDSTSWWERSEHDEDDCLEVVLGAGVVPQAVEEAMKAMVAGERAEFLCDPAFAYRDSGVSGRVPPESVVTVRVHLASFDNPPKHELEAYEQATAVKDRGSAALKAFLSSAPQPAAADSKQLLTALRYYEKAFEKIGKLPRPFETNVKSKPQDDSSLESKRSLVDQLAALRSQLYTNVAHVYYLRGDVKRAIDIATKGKRVDPRHAKLGYRLALCYLHQTDYDEALSVCEDYCSREVGPVAEWEALADKIKQARHDAAAKEAKSAQRMFL